MALSSKNLPERSIENASRNSFKAVFAGIDTGCLTIIFTREDRFRCPIDGYHLLFLNEIEKGVPYKMDLAEWRINWQSEEIVTQEPDNEYEG